MDKAEPALGRRTATWRAPSRKVLYSSQLPLSCTSHETSCLIARTYSSSGTATPKPQRDFYRVTDLQGYGRRAFPDDGVHLSRCFGAPSPEVATGRRLLRSFCPPSIAGPSRA